MNKDIIAIALVALVLAGGVIAYFDTYEPELAPVAPEPAIQADVEVQPKEETMEEKMKRWDRGEFTPEEVAEIREEEKREDEAIKYLSN
jgi:hypothetical protein